MQERRFRPGDVLDDYCPHERRITDHAVVAMIDDDVKRTRCVVCETEHEYKAAKVPVRKKPAPAALFTQVLDGLQGPTSRPPASPPPDAVLVVAPPPVTSASPEPAAAPASMTAAPSPGPAEPRAPESLEDGPVRRPLIRAQFPKFEGQPVVPRALPEFTVQSLNSRGGRPGGGAHRMGGAGGGKFRGRRHGGGQQDQNVGPMRFGRDQGNGPADGSGRPPGHGGRRRRGKKHS